MFEGPVDDPHRQRGLQMMRAHPELKGLYGRNPWTAAIVAGLVLGQFSVALLLSWIAAPWWMAIAVAWGFGAFVCHALFASIHEATHQLVFRSPLHNRLVMIAANLPLLAPFAVSLGHWHLVHHRTQGQRSRDPDLPAEWELHLFRGVVGKWVWHAFFPIIQAVRTLHPDERDALAPTDPWLLVNVGAQVAVAAALFGVLGTGGWVYLVASLYFLFALHPLFGRYIQEHVVLFQRQETTSYYGPLNKVSLNFGHHVEHHDLPAVPWNRLPQVRALAPEFFERPAHHSWTCLWLRFLFDPSVQIASRVVRSGEQAPPMPALRRRSAS